MAIEVRCACGKRLKARDQNAGKKVRCSACGAAVPVPLPREKTAPPTQSRRSRALFWTPPLTGVPSFVALTDQELGWESIVRASKVAEAREKIEGGLQPSQVLGLAKDIIPLGAITRVRMDIKRRMVYVSRGDPLESQAPFFSFTEQKAAADFFEALHQRLGPGWVRRSKQFSRFRAALEPVGGMTACVVVLLVAVGSGDPFASILRILFVAFVVLVFLACLTWLILYMRDPPLMEYLEPGG
jgi:hypothetical protein